GRWGSLDVSRESGVVPFLTRDGTQENDNDKIKDTQQNSSQQHRKPTSTAPGSGHLPNAAAVLGALTGLAAVGLAASATRDSDPPIPVADAKTLGEIGRNPNYPPNGTYRQTVPCIDGGQLQSIGNETHPFTGIFHGENGTIGNLRHCLIKNLAGEGLVVRLRLTNANITSKGPAAVVACEISENATISNIRVENAHVSTSGRKAYGGVVAGIAKGKVDNTMAVNCTVRTSGKLARGGVVAGIAKGKVDNTRAVNCKVLTSGESAHAGVGAGMVDHGTVADTRAVNCKVRTSGRLAKAGVGAGRVNRGTVADTTAVKCNIITEKVRADAAIGAGHVNNGTVANTTAVDCHVKTGGDEAYAAIGAGHLRTGIVTYTKALDSTVNTTGIFGSAGIGSGAVENGNVANTTAVDCHVETVGKGANAAVGTGSIKGRSLVERTTALSCTVKTKKYLGRAGIGAAIAYDGGTVAWSTAVNCNVTTAGDMANAAIGIGELEKSATAANTLAVNSNVATNGTRAYAGIGAGRVNETNGNTVTVTDTTAVNCRIEALGLEAEADIVSNHTRVCNTYLIDMVNDRVFNSPGICPLDLDDVCKPVAHPLSLLLPDCQPKQEYLDQLGMPRNFSSDFFSVETLPMASAIPFSDLPCPAPSAACDSEPIPVADAETLGMIGRNKSYPRICDYRQTVPCIDGSQLQSIGN
ncbi:hypothetical protein, partial [Endozoicomonas sp. YOMI1]|uniref:hypothetical protein n=1 Tax=Endozoicomonas sp. YOMI1 TaxID=2828739 RepID=UPI002148D5A5